MKIPKEAQEITLAVLRNPELHYKSCYEDSSGRPIFNCCCPLDGVMTKIALAKVSDEKLEEGR